MGREVAAGPRVHRHDERDRHRERPHRVGLRLLLERDRQHPAVHAGLHERGGHDRGRPADRAGGVDPQQRLADGTESLGEVELGHHHALEQVGCLADHDGVDVVEVDPGVGERAIDRLAAEARDRDVLALGSVVGLADADHGCGLLAHPFRPMTQSRFCCRAGPLTSRGRATRSAHAVWIRRAASPIRLRPALNIGLPASAPPDGLMRTSSPRPQLAPQDQLLVAERRVQLGDVDARRGPSCPRRRVPCDGERVRSRLPSWSGIDVVRQAGDPGWPVDDVARAVVGGEHQRRGSVGDGRAVVLAERVGIHRPREQLGDRRPALPDGVLVVLGVGQRTVHDLGHRLLVPGAGRRSQPGPGGPRARRCRARAGSSCTGRAAARGYGAARRPRTCRSRRR